VKLVIRKVTDIWCGPYWQVCLCAQTPFGRSAVRLATAVSWEQVPQVARSLWDGEPARRYRARAARRDRGAAS
jgi:hypothetical protein